MHDRSTLSTGIAALQSDFLLISLQLLFLIKKWNGLTGTTRYSISCQILRGLNKESVRSSYWLNEGSAGKSVKHAVLVVRCMILSTTIEVDYSSGAFSKLYRTVYSLKLMS